MIMCPACQHQEIEGALFCSECGAQLHDMGRLATQNIQTNEIRNQFFGASPKKESQASSMESMAFQILDGGQMLPLSGRNEFTIGRVSEGQTIMPDIDLTEYRAYEYGVSRLHAVLKRKDNQVTIMDLGSSNGTYVSGVRLQPESEYPLHHGSIISLGKLKIQFLLHR